MSKDGTGDELNTRLSDLERNLIELRLTGGQGGVRYAAKLLQERLKGHASTLGTLIDQGISTFNDMLRRQNAGQVTTKVP